MSTHQPPVQGYNRKRPYPHDVPPTPTPTWAPRYSTHSTFSSSPQRSSSPPRTPYFSAHTYGYAHIRSSPEIGSDIAFRGVGEHFEDPSMSWTHRHSRSAHVKYSEPAYTRVPKQSRYPMDHDYPPSSDFEVLELSEEVEHDIPDLDSEPTSDGTPGQTSGLYSDSEEEEETRGDDKDGFGYSFGYASNRTTFFRTSAERGQWKTNPMPFRPTAALLQTRKSAPTLSRGATPAVSLATPPRTISEPAPSITAEIADFAAQKSNMPDRATEDASSNSASIPIIPPTEEEPQSPHTLPSLTSDRESSLDIDYHDTPSSPLPSSSPPMSHTSFSVSRLSRSISPISYDRESSAMRSSSPLSELPDDDDDPFNDGEDTHVISDNSDNQDSTISAGSLESTSTTLLPEATPQTLKATPADAVTTHESHVGASVSIAPAPPATTEGSSSNAKPNLSSSREDVVMAPTGENPSPSLSACASPFIDEEIIDVVSNSPKAQSSKGKVREASVDKKSAALRDKNGVIRSLPEVASARATSKEKEKRKKEITSEGPVAKKRKTSTGVDVGISSSGGKRRVEEDENENANENANEAASEPVSAPVRKQKRKKVEGDIATETVAATTSTTKNPAKSRHSKARASSLYTDEEDDDDMEQDAPLDPETADLHAQACGLLIETMALSRASSLPVSTLYKLVMQSQPALKAQRTEREWLRLFDRVLHAGEAGRGSGVFGKVESSGKDKADRPLEAQWFYVPELDEDQERATLIKAMMPRPAKRSETKKYKQYYWRPVDKLSMWDPEDSL